MWCVVRRWMVLGGGRGEGWGVCLLLLLPVVYRPGVSKKGNIRLRQGTRDVREQSCDGWFFWCPFGTILSSLLRLRQVQPRCGGWAGRFGGGYTIRVVAKQEPRHGGGVVSRARGQIGFSEAAAAAVRLVGWVWWVLVGWGIKLLLKQNVTEGQNVR